MSGFSTRSEETIERKLDVTLSTVCKTDEELIEKYDLWKCTKWISDNQFEKVCLQFPDSLLNDSVGVSLWLEKEIGKKCYILGDTSYGSCCTDEVAAEHIDSDAIIHFGHSCLSPTVRLPVFYVFPKCKIDINKFLQVLREHCTLTQAQTVLIFDVSYCHYIGVIKDHLEGCDIVIAEPLTNGETCVNSCSKHCQLLNGETKHSVCKLGRSYCLANNNSELTNIVFIGSKDSRTLYNFRISFTGPVFCYTESDGLEPVSIGKSLQRRWYLMERIKDAKTIGVVICTLGVSGYLEAIKRISTLIRRKGKKCYVISVGKPTVAKLANFPEIEIYVMVSCPEAVLENEKDFYQPIVSVMEAEMALNEARSWSEISSSDFRDIIPGGVNYVDVPNNSSGDTEPDVSLVSNKIRYNHNNELKDFSSPDLCGTVQLRSDMTVDMMSSNLANRSWHGLDPSFGEVPVSKAVQGRSGIPQAYSEEEKHTML